MQRIIILFSLVFFISCTNNCAILTRVDDSKTCFSYESLDENSRCCNFIVSIDEGPEENVCFQIKKNVNDAQIKQFAQNLINQNKEKFGVPENISVIYINHDCNNNKGSYLRVGFLLLSLFLL